MARKYWIILGIIAAIAIAIARRQHCSGPVAATALARAVAARL